MHHPHSFALLVLSFLLQVANGTPQVTAQPALLASLQGPAEQPTTTAGQTCGGCVIVADVAGIIWYSEVFIQTAATAFVGVGVGNNGSRVTRTSIVSNDAGEFTFSPQAGTAEYGTAPLAVNVGYQTSTEIGGATLVSPTAYNVFSAYTYTNQQQLANGGCDSTSTVVTLSSAYTETVATASGRVYLDLAGQQGFISFLGFSTCTGGGEKYVGTALVQVSQLTASISRTYSGVALAAMSTTFAPTTRPTSTAPVRTTTLTDVLTTLTATLSGSSTITPAPTESAEAPEIVIGNTTITPNGNPVDLPFVTASAITATGTGAIGTGAGGGTGGNATVPFISNAPSWGSGLSIWGSGLLIFLMAVGWVL
ncbi:MAG: hypothetical protein L6R40_004337 [Gallowayella cf. fulva]|nr:MAG: hypothetical protein L6R40_004337 [Xanthomendoza cf. fulva]